MRNIFHPFTILLLVIFFEACEKNNTNDPIETPIEEPKPIISVYPARQINDTSAFLKSSIKGLSIDDEFGFIVSSIDETPEFGGNDCISYKLTESLNDTFSIELNKLKPETTYYYTSYIYKDNLYYYGDVLNFSTNGFITDIDGNIYRIVKIGDQWWMAENLKTTTYNDGELISNIADNDEWNSDTLGAYCWFENYIGFKEISGALYNWYSVNIGKLSPSGWHVASVDDWSELISFVGADGFDGNALRAKTGWFLPGTQESHNIGTDIYGFSAIPGGMRFGTPDYHNTTFFLDNEWEALWWTTNLSEEKGQAKRYRQEYENSFIRIGNGYKTEGCSVRCVKNR